MLIRIWDPESFLALDPIRDGKIRIRDKHPGFATLLLAQVSSFKQKPNRINVRSTALVNKLLIKHTNRKKQERFMTLLINCLLTK